MTRGLWVTALCGASVAGVSRAHAEVRVGGDIALLPIGAIQRTVIFERTSATTRTAYALGGLLDYSLPHCLSVGFAPRLIFDVEGDGEGDSVTRGPSHQLDLRSRFAGTRAVTTTVHAYGYLSAGFSVLFLAPNSFGSRTSPYGLVVGLGGGVAYTLRPRFALTGELGSQIGFFQGSVPAATTSLPASFRENYFHVSVGFTTTL